MAGALARRHEALHVVREGDQADLVVVGNRAERQQRGNLGRHLALLLELRAELLALNRPGNDEVHRVALAGNALAQSYARVVEALLTTSGRAREGVVAVGCHGQTIRHRPAEFDGIGYTVQVNAPALLAELSRIDVVADFRSRDVAAGGQGAPLVPAFHRALFSRSGEATAVLNLGGIANLSAIGTDGATLGFDCGPANALLDLWCAASTVPSRFFDRTVSRVGVVGPRI